MEIVDIGKITYYSFMELQCIDIVVEVWQGSAR